MGDRATFNSHRECTEYISMEIVLFVDFEIKAQCSHSLANLSIRYIFTVWFIRPTLELRILMVFDEKNRKCIHNNW